MHYRDAVKTNKGPTILQIRVLRTNVLVLRDAFSIGLWPSKDCGLCRIGVDGTWGKAVELESPSQAMALS